MFLAAVAIYAVLVGVAASPWVLARMRTRSLGVTALILGAADLAAGVLGWDVWPWSNILVVAVAITSGTWLGRALPARRRPMLVFLLVLAILDTSQLLFSGGTSSATLDSHAVWAHLTWMAEGQTHRLGIADLVLTATIAEHLRRRTAGRVRTIVTPVGGFLLAGLFVFTTGVRDLVLIPFLFLAWLLGEAVRSSGSQAVSGRNGSPFS